jgi:TrpR-related protein YerC/YecD
MTLLFSQNPFAPAYVAGQCVVPLRTLKYKKFCLLTYLLSRSRMLKYRKPALCRQNRQKNKERVRVMVKIGKKEKNDQLYKAILMLKDEQECYEFFQDLCTVSELRAMEQRFEVASLLNDGMIYNEILERTGASSATISRVNRSLSYGTGAYEKLFARMKEKKQ